MPPTPPSVQRPLPTPDPVPSGSNVYICTLPAPDPSHPANSTASALLAADSLVIRIVYPLEHELTSDEKESGQRAVQFWHDALPDLPNLIAGLVGAVINTLYPDTDPSVIIKKKQVVTIKIKEYKGLAATHDDTIDISLSWLRDHASKPNPLSTHPSASPSAYEFKGVLIHELVHIYQHDGSASLLHTPPDSEAQGGQAPWWFIEGLADFVRYTNMLGALHWGPEGSGNTWEEGYQTTGMFLAWLDRGEWTGRKGVVKRMNERLEKEGWPGGDAGGGGWWKEMTGYEVKDLWGMYKTATNTATPAAAGQASG